MVFLKLPLFLAAAMVFRGVDGACVEDNCYGGKLETPQKHVPRPHIK